MLVHIVEDDAAAARSLVRLLERQGCAVKVYPSGLKYVAEVIAKNDRAPDLLLCDLLLPGGMDGFRLCERFRDTPAMKNSKVIVMTGLAWRGQGQLRVELMQRFGVSELLEKPFDGKDLLKAMDRVVARWRIRALAADNSTSTNTQATVEAPSAKTNAADVDKGERGGSRSGGQPAANDKPHASRSEKAKAEAKDVTVGKSDEANVTLVSKAFAAAAPDPMRASPRLPARYPVKFRTAEDFVREYTSNISAGGMFIEAQQPPAVGGDITVELELPDGKPALEMPATVVHATAGKGFGVQLRVSQRARERWLALVEKAKPKLVDPSDPNARIVALIDFAAARSTEITRMLGLLWRPEMTTVPANNWDDLFKFHHLHLAILNASNVESKLVEPAEIRRFFAHFSASLVVVGTEKKSVLALQQRYKKLLVVPAITSDKLLSKLGSLLQVPVRSALRVNTRLSATFNGRPCIVADLSLTGARLEVGFDVAIDSDAKLTVELPDRGAVDAQVTARWVREVNGGTQVGVSFERVPKKGLELLDAYVTKETHVVRGLMGITEQSLERRR